MKIMYTRPDDGGVSIVVALPKEDIERVLGPLTQDEYEQHVIERSIPSDAINVKTISDDDIPADREFRNAWVDATEDTKINIDLARAKELKLQELREKRDVLLQKTDTAFLIALEEQKDLTEIKAEKERLRDITNPLKNLAVSGVDDEAVLAKIKELSTLES